MVKNLFKLFILFFIFGCAVKQKTQTPVAGKTPPSAVKETTPTTEAETSISASSEVSVESSQEEAQQSEVSTTLVGEPEKIPTKSVKSIPRIGLIFSAGGAKAWAHIGFIKEIEKAKWPIHSVAGFEWGSVVAAVYANSFSSNEVEWELSKVRDFENITEISESIFSKKSVNDLKIPFVCPSFNIAKQTLYLLNRGQLNKLIPFCLAHPPLSAPYSQSVAGMSDISGLAQHLRATGANKIILINVMSQNNKHSFTEDYLSAENIIWAESAALMAGKIAGVDDVIKVNLDDYGIKDINKKREIIAKGAELSYDQVQKLSKKYGL